MRHHFVLDVNETLSDMGPLGAVLEGHGAPPALARAWFAAVLRDGFALSLHRRAPAFLDLCRQDLERQLHGVERLDAPVAAVVEEVLEAMSRLGVHPDVVPGLRALAAAGHRLTAFSNGSTAATAGLLERAGVLEHVDDVLSVEDGTVWKPHPEAYAAAAGRLAVPPEELTLVAVHPWDVDGAVAAGLRATWLNRDEGPWPLAFRHPGSEVRTLTDLARDRS